QAPVAQYNADGSIIYLHRDQLGSTRAVTDATTGDTLATYAYDPYGNRVASTGDLNATRFQYAGEYTDAETGFQSLRARYYDPATGQFITRDPLNGSTRDPYGYAGNDGINRSDPTGLAWGIPEWIPVVGGGCVAMGTEFYEDSSGTTRR